MSRAHVRATWTLYEKGYSVGVIARLVWQRFGYSSPGTCRTALFEVFYAEGYRLRSKSEASSLRWKRYRELQVAA